MAKRVGVISINLLAGTAEFNANMDKARAKLGQLGPAANAAGHATVSSMQASSAAIRVMEGGMSNNLRAVERFVAGTLKLGPILQAAFPLVGAFAFLGLVVKIGTEVVEFFKKLEEGPARVANAFRTANQTVKTSSDELRLVNDRLLNDIAKLEGRHQNGVKVALDEAVVAADKLAESLGKDLSELNKLLKEEELGTFKALLSGQSATTDIRKRLFGESGFEGPLGHDVPEITQKGEDALSALRDEYAARGTTEERKKGILIEENNSRLKTRQELEKVFVALLEASNAKLKAASDLEKAGPRITVKDESGKVVVSGQRPDAKQKTSEEEGVNRRLRAARALYLGQFENQDIVKKKESDEIAKANAEQSRPLDDKLKELDAKLNAAAARLAALGKDPDTATRLKAHAAAVVSIEEVSKALKNKGVSFDKKGPDAQRIENAYQGIAVIESEGEYKARLIATTEALNDRIAEQKLLTEAIGEGYEAAKKAAGEAEKIRFSKGQTPEWKLKNKADIDARGQQGEDLFAEKNRTSVGSAVDKLNDQIELEKELAKVQGQGAEAIRQVTLALRLKKIAGDEDVEGAKKRIAAEQELYAATKATAVASDLAQLGQEIADTQRLTAARIRGAEALRLEVQQLEYEKLAKEGRGSTTAALHQADEVRAQAEVTAEVLNTVNAQRNHLAQLDKEYAATVALLKTDADRAGIELKLRDIMNDRLKAESNELLLTGTAKNGVKAFFLDMQQSAKTTGEILNEALHQAVDKASHSLAELITGGKANFGQVFKDIGKQIVESQVKASIQKGLGKLGEKLGIKPHLDGQSYATAQWVRIAGGGNGIGQPGDPALPGGQGVPGSSPTSTGSVNLPPALPHKPKHSTWGSILTGIGQGLSAAASVIGLGMAVGGGGGGGDLSETWDSSSHTGSNWNAGGQIALTPRAGGGDMSADKAYIVGEAGPELMTRTRGTIHSNAESRKMLTGVGPKHYYNIDARGTDPVLTEMRTRAAIITAHNSAVGTAVQATVERGKRTPQR